MDQTIIRVLQKCLQIFFVMMMMLGILTELDSGSKVYASPGSINLADGSVTITATDYTQNGTTYPYTGNYSITGTNNSVRVMSGTHNITLSGVNIDVTAIYLDTAFNIDSGAVVNLTLEGENTLKSGNYRPGLGVPNGASLLITEASSGSVTAIGGFCAAGIGGVWGGTSGNITISGGTVNATGGGGAGIGGGEDGSGGTTTISGGTVNATGTSGSAGIGGGEDRDSYNIVSGGSITISGGTVTATATGSIFSLGAGIGNGYHNTGVSTIIISGGTVKANGFSSTPKNSMSEDVYKTTLTLLSGHENAAISNLSVKHSGITYSYGGDDVYTVDQGKLYLYLPQSSVDTNITFTVNDSEYAYVLTAGNSGTNNGVADRITPNVISIAITTPATKLTYIVGNTLDISGMVVKGTYSDSLERELAITTSNVSGFNSSSPVASQTLTVTVGGKTTTYTVVINPALNSIAISTPATKLTYIVGDDLDITGMVVTGTYSDSSTQELAITTASVSGFNSSTPVASQTLTVTVGGKITTYTVVINPALNSIAITTPATKLTYIVGNDLDITGMVVTGTYSDSSTQELAITTANVSGFNSSSPATSQTLTVTVEGKTTTYTVVINPALSSIAITTPATKLTYIVGDDLDITGMVVTGTYSDSSTQVLAITIGNVSGFNSSSSAASQTLTVTVEGKTTTYTVVINPALNSIAISIPATKLTYIVGDSLDITGMVVTGTYSDSSTQELAITTANVSGFNSSTPAAIQILTVTVEGKTTTYTVVINPALNSIAVTTPATKLTYIVGDDLDITGMVVTGTYSDSSTQELAITTANVSGFNSSTPAAIQILTVTVEGKTTTYTVVINPALNSIAITTPATKLTYIVGDDLDISGMVVTGTYCDSSTQELAITTANISGFNSSTPAAIQILMVTVEGKTTTYTVVINAVHMVSVSASPVLGGTVTGGNTYHEGASVILTATANSEYNFTNWTENGSEVSTSTAYTFTLGTTDRTLVANFTAIPNYTISIDTLTDGNITANRTSATSGTAINLTITPDAGMRLQAETLKYNDGTQDYAISGTSFIMPAAHVTVSAVFGQLLPDNYSVSIGPLTGGSITAPPSATSGSAINLIITPNSGMELKAGTLKYNDGTQDHAISGTSFIMPAANVTVSAVFERNTYLVTFNSNGGSNVSSQNVNQGGKVTQPTAPTRSGYTFSGWYSDPGQINIFDFTNTAIMTNTEIYAKWTADSHSDDRDGSDTPSPKPTTVTGIVIDSTTGTQISNITATVTTDINANTTISLNAAQVVVQKHPDGTVSPFSDLSKVTITSSVGTQVTISADGTIQATNLAKGTDNTFKITYDLGNGQKVTMGTIEIKIGSNGNVTVTTSLIDPYGIIIDAATGRILEGVKVILYYAHTDRNKATGKTPDTVVILPGIAGFEPNDNKNPQVSDANGAYGFMVFPTTDYYLVAIKEGYNQYTSPTISVEQEIVKWDFKMNQPTSGVTRLAGLSSVDTALEIAKASYTGKVQNVLLATAGNYPDALAGSVLAYKLNAPILLVGSSDADQKKVLNYMKSNLDPAGTVYILGGTVVISSAMEGKVTVSGFENITRLGGVDRYDTSVKIADQLEVKTGTSVVLVSGENYPDALSISSIAAQMQIPILLVQKNGFNDTVREEIAVIKPTKVYIIGGQGVISTAVENQVAQITGLAQTNIVRIGGVDRYETSLAVAQYFNLSGQSVCVATGNNFPDALAGSVYAANHNTSIILADGSLSNEVINYLRSKKMTGATLFGGEIVVSKDIEQQLGQLIGELPLLINDTSKVDNYH